MTKKDKKEYVPNRVSIWARLLNLILSSIFIIWGGYSVWQNDLVVIIGSIPRQLQEHHLHGKAAVVMYMGLLFVSACLISEIVDHYDKRNNEHIYHRIATWTLWPGVFLCMIGILIG